MFNMHEISGVIISYSKEKNIYTLFTNEYGKVRGYIRGFQSSRVSFQCGSLVSGYVDAHDLLKKYLVIHTCELVNIYMISSYEKYILAHTLFFFLEHYIFERSALRSVWILLCNFLYDDGFKFKKHSFSFFISFIYYLGVFDYKKVDIDFVVEEKNLLIWTFFEKKLICKKKDTYSILNGVQHVSIQKKHEKHLKKLIDEMEKYGLL